MVIGGSAGFQRLVKVIVLEIGRGCVKLGFAVDADIPIHRLEIWEQIRAGVRRERSRAGPTAPA
jgi:sRNA-binding carbon storage regulator CsrA